MIGTSSSLSSEEPHRSIVPIAAAAAVFPLGGLRGSAAGAGAEPAPSVARLGTAGLRRKMAGGAEAAPAGLPTACSRQDRM